MNKAKDFPLIAFCFLTFFVVIPAICSNLEWATNLSLYHGFGRFGVIAYASVSMAIEGAIAKILRLKEFFVPYFFSLSACLFAIFLMFCVADSFLIFVGAIAR